jgi:hypothetical protein
MAILTIENSVLVKCILADGETKVTIPDSVASTGEVHYS